LNNANQNSIFAGPASGGAGAPSFQTAPTFSGLNLTALPSNTALYPTLNQNTTGTSGGFTAGNASNLNSGTVPTARLGSGTASSSTILFGDQTYKSDSIFASAIPSGAANDSATGGAYVAASTTPTVSSYSAYPFYVISFAATSDNAADTVTLNINGLGAKPVLLSTGNQAEAFNFQNSGTPVLLYYNGTAFVEVNPNPNVMADTFSFGIPGSDPYFYSDSTQQVNIDGTNLILGNGASIGVGSGSNINLASGCPIAFPNSDIVDQYLQDINGETSLDFNNRYLIASDGSSDLLHWDTAADLQASLAAALTGFTGTLNLGSMTLGLTSSQIPGVNVQGLSTAIPLEAGLNVFSGSTARTTPLPAPASGAHVAVKSVASATETISSNSGSQIFATGATSASASVTLTSGSATEFWSDGTYWYQK
jgi:hypothetical protein